MYFRTIAWKANFCAIIVTICESIGTSNTWSKLYSWCIYSKPYKHALGCTIFDSHLQSNLSGRHINTLTDSTSIV